jgi:hypothetical protein
LENRRAISEKCPVEKATVTLVAMAGMMTSAIAGFSPIADTKNGKAHDE